jgi:hypothetical protein
VSRPTHSELLQSSSELLLKGEVSSPLHRRHEARELALLLLDQLVLPALEREQRIELRADPLLVGSGRHHLLPECLTSQACLPLQLRAPRLEPTTQLGQLGHLLATQPDPSLRLRPQRLADAPLELRSPRGRPELLRAGAWRHLTLRGHRRRGQRPRRDDHGEGDDAP